jgi:hypothetical protein
LLIKWCCLLARAWWQDWKKRPLNTQLQEHQIAHLHHIAWPQLDLSNKMTIEWCIRAQPITPGSFRAYSTGDVKICRGCRRGENECNWSI